MIVSSIKSGEKGFIIVDDATAARSTGTANRITFHVYRIGAVQSSANPLV